MEALSRSSEEDGFAAVRRQEQKQTKYDKLMLSGGNTYIVPRLFHWATNTGRRGQAAEDYF